MSRLWRTPALWVPYVLCATVLCAQQRGTKVRQDQIEFGAQTASQVLASPAGIGGVPVFRPIAPDDIPPLTQSKIANLTTDLASKYSYGADASLSSVAVTPLSDASAGMFRRFEATQTNPVLGVQTENGVWIGYFDAIGRLNFPGQPDGCARWSNGVLDSTGSPCGTGGGGGGSAGGSLNTVQFHGPGGTSMGYDEITIDPITKQLSVPSLRITGSGAGVMRLASGPEPSGRAGTGTLFSETGELLSFKPGTGTKQQIAMMGGHLSGPQTDPNVSSFSLTSNGSLGAKALTISCANDNVTGTALKLLAKRSTSGDRCVKASTMDVGVPVYIVTGGAGTTGSAEIAEGGRDLCTFDEAGTVGDYVVVSTLTAGQCHAVAAPSSNDWVVGQLTTPVSGAGIDGTVHISPWVKSAGGGLSDPGAAGMVKRTALNTTAIAVACTDYYAPGCAIQPADLPAGGSGGGGGAGGVALKTPTFQGVSTVSNDGSVGTNGCPGGCAETAFAQYYRVPANSLVAGKRYRLTIFGNITSSTSSNPTYTVRVKAASSSETIASGTTIVTMPGISMTSGCTNCTGGATIMITATGGDGTSSSVYASPVGNSLVAVTGSSGRNSTAQPVNLATNADIYLGLTIYWSASTAAASFTLHDFIVEELN